MFTSKQIKNTTYWYNSTLLTEDVELVFSVEYWRDKNAIIGSAQGRGTTWFVKGNTGEFALRHYHRGGLFGKLVKDSYWFTGLENTRAYQELLLLKTLTENHVNVPTPIAAKVERCGSFYKADILVEKLDNAKDLVSILNTQKLSKVQLLTIGKEIRKMHEIGVNHTDLNIHNILMNNNKVWIIDFDKCRQQDGNEWKQGNLERLKRSFTKEIQLGKINAENFCFQEIEKGYQNAPLSN
ncbi:3-deoxy-D-manno-octulosonic acid kinase [Vibrio amylolyticus]|uniref:3-deoxy-D-manno-octulosonic acid kinase n=1 Tax=Vibrio amylolyticus TaxID=2847292 RepID=UPI00354DE9E1